MQEAIEVAASAEAQFCSFPPLKNVWIGGQLVAGSVCLFLMPYLFSADGLRAFYVVRALLGAGQLRSKT